MHNPDINKFILQSDLVYFVHVTRDAHFPKLVTFGYIDRNSFYSYDSHDKSKYLIL